MRLVRPGGIVLWHDYGVWTASPSALEELEAARQLGLVNISGTQPGVLARWTGLLRPTTFTAAMRPT